MRFVEKYPIKDLNPADYNPRKINENAFIKLQESLRLFGVVKPVILNGNGILTAGHQRTKAMKSIGIEETPAIILKEISLHDEIKFNLFHNSIETNKSEVFLTDTEHLSEGFHWIDPSQIQVTENNNPTITYEIGALIAKYGPWGSVVISENGRVIDNSDYAVTCEQLQKPLLIYKMINDKPRLFLDYMKIKYGSYNYESLGIKSYNQLHCQMNRMANDKNKLKSSTYENFVLPYLKKHHRLIDFGAGKCGYVNRLRQLGYQTYAYEPHFQKKGTHSIDIRSVIRMIKLIEKDIEENGLYDIVVLDSVLNSVVNLDFEHLVMTTCNSLMKSDGVFITGTRNLESVTEAERYKKRTSHRRRIEFLDENNFSGTFRNGVWTLQRFHDLKSLKKLCEKYFEDVKVIKTSSTSSIYSFCKKPRKLPIEEYEKALNVEFNMEYPNNYRHNKHKGLVNQIKNNLVRR